MSLHQECLPPAQQQQQGQHHHQQQQQQGQRQDKFDALRQCAQRLFTQQSRDLTQIESQVANVTALEEKQKVYEKQLSGTQKHLAGLNARLEDSLSKSQVLTQHAAEMELCTAKLAKETSRISAAGEAGKKINHFAGATSNGVDDLLALLSRSVEMTQRAAGLTLQLPGTAEGMVTRTQSAMSALQQQALSPTDAHAAQNIDDPVLSLLLGWGEGNDAAAFPPPLQRALSQLLQARRNVAGPTFPSLAVEPSPNDLQTGLNALSRSLAIAASRGFTLNPTLENLAAAAKADTEAAISHMARHTPLVEGTERILRHTAEADDVAFAHNQAGAVATADAAQITQDAVSIRCAADASHIRATEITAALRTAQKEVQEAAALLEDAAAANSTVVVTDFTHLLPDGFSAIYSLQHDAGNVGKLQEEVSALERQAAETAALDEAEAVNSKMGESIALADCRNSDLRRLLDLHGELLQSATDRTSTSAAVDPDCLHDGTPTWGDGELSMVLQEHNLDPSPEKSARHAKLVENSATQWASEAAMQLSCQANEVSAAVARLTRRRQEAESRMKQALADVELESSQPFNSSSSSPHSLS